MKRISTVLFLVGMCLSSIAQSDLSLSQALEICLSNNLQLKYQSKQQQISANNNNWANAGRSPSVSVSLANQSDISQVNNPANLFLPEQLSYTSGVTGSVEMSLVLYSGGE